MITVNIDKAKEVRKNQLRGERVSLLLDLDVQFQRALETGADTSAIVAEKQRLRNITEQCDRATTVDELKAVSVSSRPQGAHDAGTTEGV